jgi:hypothetical protein
MKIEETQRWLKKGYENLFGGMCCDDDSRLELHHFRMFRAGNWQTSRSATVALFWRSMHRA